MPTHPGHPAIASTTLVSASRSLLNDAFDSVSLQTVTATATLNPDDGRYVLVAPASHTTITLPDPASDERYQNVRLVLKRTTAGVYTATVVVAGGGLIDGSSSTTLNAQYDCEVLFSDGTAWHRLRDQTNLLAPDYLDFGDWIVGTDDSNPAPVATSDAYTAPDGTTTADELEWDNTTELADESWAEPGASVLEAGDGAEYSFYIDSEVGDGIKTVLEVEDTSVPGLLEQTTVAFSNVFGRELKTSLGFDLVPSSWGAVTTTDSPVAAPDGSFTARTSQGGFSGLNKYFLNRAAWPGHPDAAVDSGEQYSAVLYHLAEATSRRYNLQFYASTTANRIIVDYNLDTTGVTINSFSATSTGPAYTVSNSVRFEQVAGTDWWKAIFRVADYSGLGGNLQYTHYKYAEATYWRNEFYQGDHVSSQQLLTVDDGVENLQPPFNADNGTISTSAIAAPDGTLTADKFTANSTSGVIHFARVNTEAATLGDAWNPGSAWTYSIYVYPPGWSHSAMSLGLWSEGGATSTWVLATFNSSMAITSFLASSVGVTYTAERNISVEAIGHSGWYRVSLVVHDWNADATRIRANAPYLPSYTDPDWYYDYWSPALRYGDWVARGKNWQGTPLIDWAITAGASKAYSSTPAPDGTLSAVEISLPAGGPCDLYATNTLAATVPAYASVTFEAYINHSDGDWDSGRIYHYLRSSSSFPEMVYIQISPAGGFAGSLVTLATAGPGYTTAEHAEATQIGTDGWWRYRLTITDYGGTALTAWSYLRADNSAGATRGVFWGPRITVGNPADARGYFVSGPQNLLGDGSDIGSWATSGGSTVSTNTEVAPNGRLEADTIQNTQGVSGVKQKAHNITPTADATYDFIIYFKRDASALAGASELTFAPTLYTSGYASITERVTFRVSKEDPSTSTLTGSVSGGPGYLLDDLSITALSNDWYRWHIRLQDYNGTAAHISYRLESAGAGYSSGATYDITVAAAEVTTIDRTPTATDLRPISGGIVDYDAYPAEHRSLFASYEDAGDNWYKVTMNLTEPN